MKPERVGRRVDDVPDPFVVSADVAATSPLHRRLVLAEATPGAHDVGPLIRALSRPWQRFQVTADVGLQGMVSAREFSAAIRGLADDLLLPQVLGQQMLQVTMPTAGAADVATFRGLFPDAVSSARSVPEGVVTRPPDRLDSRPDRLILIVGAGRSGTTWLEQLLIEHPRVGGVPHWESWIFEQLQPVWDDAVSLPVAPAIRRYCDAIFTATLARHSPGADHIVEKTPMHSYHLRRIASVYPDAWVVHLLRDGRDVARSMSRVPFFRVPDVGDAAAMWARVVTAVRDAQPTVQRFREVRYEDLYADPVAVVTDLFEWIGLTVDDNLRDALARAAGERVSIHAGTSDRVGPGSWRGLPPRELNRIYRRAGTALRREGYADRSAQLRTRLRSRFSGR